MNRKLENCKRAVEKIKDNVFLNHIEEIEAISKKENVDISVSCSMWVVGKDIVKVFGSAYERAKQETEFLKLFPTYTFADVKEVLKSADK